MTSNTTRKGYVIAVDEIVDMERFTGEYLPVTAETIEAHGGTVLVGSFDPRVVEGEWNHSLTVVVEFPSVDVAESWYEDEAYQEIKQVRLDTCDSTDLVITAGFSPDDLS